MSSIFRCILPPPLATALNLSGQTSRQAPHFMQVARIDDMRGLLLARYGPDRAALVHSPQPCTSQDRWRRRSDLRQTRAGHLLFRMCSSNSSRKYLKVVRTGLGALPPGRIGSRSSQYWPVSPAGEVLDLGPASGDLLQDGQHLPCADAAGRAFAAGLAWVKVRKNLARSTMQVSSSMMIMQPEPMIEPFSVSDS